MSKAVVMGNGESRSWYNPDTKWDDVKTWGCNAVYRDAMPDNLVAMDYAMQQEIYDSGWCNEDPDYLGIHNVHFGNWSVVPSDVADAMFMGFDIPEAFIHKSKDRTSVCVIGGKDPVTLSEKIEATIQQFPDLDMNDLKLKMEKDVGVWITYVNEIRDVVISVEGHVGYSTGNTALSLACQSGAEEVYMLGFDLSAYNKPLNNLYKGTDNYLPVSAKGFNPVNWMGQMSEVFDKYKDIIFYWVDCQVSGGQSWHGSSLKDYHSNVRHLTKNELCSKMKIL